MSVGIRLLVPLHANWWFVPGHLYLGHVQHDASMTADFALFVGTFGRLLLIFGTAGRALRGRLHGGSGQSTESVAILGWYTGPRG